MPDCQGDQSKKPATFDRGKVKYDKTNPFARSVAGPRTILRKASKGRGTFPSTCLAFVLKRIRVFRNIKRRHPDSNWEIKVLQISA